MEWEALNRLARETFKTQSPTVAMLLATWAENDPNGELIHLIEPHGLNRQSWILAMEALAGKTGMDRDLKTECIMQAADGRPTGKDLLATLCAHPDHPVTQALSAAGLDIAGLGQALANERAQKPASSCLARLGISVDATAAPLLKYGRDLTELARDGAFDGYCNRPVELDAVATVLMRMERANPAVTGEAGVGKTALIELLAREVVADRIGIDPRTRIFEISIGKLLAGTRYRGDFEERVEEVVQAVLKSAPAFLFLDEAHLLFGTGRAMESPMDMGNFLKPFLARGDLRVIAATTVDEFNRYISQDEALARRFEQVRIPEPDPQLTARMVEARAQTLARHHEIEISDEMVSRAMVLSNEHQPQKLQPYKSIDLLDTAAARARRMDRRSLDEEVLLQTLGKSLGRSVEELKGGGRKVLRDLAGFLRSRIVGQDGAIDKVVSTVVRQRQKLGPVERNLGAFLFVGPTGVGKTELARQLAVGLHGSQRDLLLLDMSEYAEPSINKLIGAPAGFVGSEQEGTLIRWLQNHPAGGVLIFDEIEKAHGEIHNLLLGALDNGRIHSARGKTLDLRPCVVILTSNAISMADLSKGPLGFSPAQQGTEVNTADLLTKIFPREFLGRLDEIILFEALKEENVLQIVRMRLEEAVERLKKRSIHLLCDMERLSDHLAEKLRALQFGARGIERLIEQTVLGPISLATLRVNDEGEMEAVIGEAFYEKGQVEVMGKKDCGL